MFALQQNKGGNWQLVALQPGSPAPKGGRTKLGSISLLDVRVRQSLAGMK